MNSAITKKIFLLVEDEAIIAMAQKAALEKYGYDVINIHSGEKAVEICKENINIDLILMDIDLGKGIDGTETAKIILKDRDIPIVFLSSHTSIDVVSKTEKITSYGYVVKNSSIAVLDASIKMALKLFEAKNIIKESEEKYKIVFDKSPIAIEYYNSMGELVDTNDECLKLFGIVNKSEIFKFKLFDDPNISNEIKSKLLNKESIRFKANFDFEKVKELSLYQTTCSGIKFLDLFIAPILKNNSLMGYILQLQDITNQKIIDQALQSSELRYRKLFETAQDGILILDVDTGKIIDVNLFLINMLGYSKEQFIEKTIWDIGFFKDSVSNKEKFQQLVSNKYVRYENLPLETKDGSLIEVEFISNIYTVDNKQVIQCNIRNISDRKILENSSEKSLKSLRESEEKFSLAFQIAPYAITITNPKDGKFIEVNNTFLLISGYSRLEIANESSISLKLWVDEKNRDEIIADLRVGKEVTEREFLFQRKTGETFPGLFSAKIISINNVPHILSSINDITERKRVEVALQLKNKEYESLLKEKELILKEVHHRIKNNIMVISSILSLQASLSSNEELKTVLEIAINRISNQSILYDKLYRSNIYQSLNSYDYFSTLINEILNGFNLQDIKIEKKIESFSLETKIIQPLSIIINELFTNAIKHAFVNSHKGIIKISILSNNNIITIIVEDNGCGIPKSISFKNSTGLGFQLISGLVDQFHGTIDINQDHGTKIVLKFNLSKI